MLDHYQILLAEFLLIPDFAQEVVLRHVLIQEYGLCY